MRKIAITGAHGLIGWHAAARLHAANCAARYKDEDEPFDLALIDRETFGDDEALDAAIAGADAVLHFAGANRGSDEEVAAANPAIATRLAAAVDRVGATPHLVYANSTHAKGPTSYGRSKAQAAEILSASAPGRFTDLVLPHIFGECARPYYNNVTATLIDQLWNGESPTINPEGRVNLLHAGAAAQLAIDAAAELRTGEIAPASRAMAISEIWQRLSQFHELYRANIFPDLGDQFDLALFNSYRTGAYPVHYPFAMRCNSDTRGTLFETAKSMGGAQSFLSTTHPGQTRGDHFHVDLVERFMVVHGEATIRIRKVLTDQVTTWHVSGDEPVAIDMPPLHTHSITNASGGEVLTFFWSNRHFDPSNPDTYADPVKLKTL